MHNICARFAQDSLPMCNICARFAQDSLPMCKIIARFAQDCTSFHNAQYMRKICTRLYFFPQCTIYAQDLCKIVLISPMRIYAQDLRKIVLISPMCKIWARLYFFLQCAIYVQNLHKIVLLFQMRNIWARFAQDCTYFSNVQYMHKICTRLYLTSNLKCQTNYGILIIGDMLFSGFKVLYGSGEMS